MYRAHRGESMSDGEGSDRPLEVLKRLNDGELGFGIERTGRFIKDE